MKRMSPQKNLEMELIWKAVARVVVVESEKGKPWNGRTFFITVIVSPFVFEIPFFVGFIVSFHVVFICRHKIL